MTVSAKGPLKSRAIVNVSCHRAWRDFLVMAGFVPASHVLLAAAATP
jgi:hypothetical protein